MPSMNPFYQLLIIVLSGILGFLLVVGVVMALKSSPPSMHTELPAEVIARSKTYVEKLGTKPFEALNTSQKLMLIHAYYNLENYAMVIQYAETMIDSLRELPTERKIAFTEIIEHAYRQLGQEQMIREFRVAIGL